MVLEKRSRTQPPNRSAGKTFLHVLFSSTMYFNKISYLLFHSCNQVHALPDNYEEAMEISIVLLLHLSS